MKPYIAIPLTSACNLSCVYCAPNGENYLTRRGVFSLQDVINILSIAQSAGITKIRFTGGEPFLYPHIRKAVESAYAFGMQVCISTNGMLLQKNLHWISELAGISINVSLNALNDSIMSRISGAARTDRVVDAIRKGSDRGVVRRINVVLNRLNFSQISCLLALCEKCGIGLKILDMNYFPEIKGCWADLYAPPSALQLRGRFCSSYDYTAKYGVPANECLVHGVQVRIKDTRNGTRYHSICKRCSFYPCQEGLYAITVTPSMTVKPCKLGKHVFHDCRSSSEMAEIIPQVIRWFEEAEYANLFWKKHSDFYHMRLRELIRDNGTSVSCKDWHTAHT